MMRGIHQKRAGGPVCLGHLLTTKISTFSVILCDRPRIGDVPAQQHFCLVRFSGYTAASAGGTARLFPSLLYLWLLLTSLLCSRSRFRLLLFWPEDAEPWRNLEQCRRQLFLLGNIAELGTGGGIFPLDDEFQGGIDPDSGEGCGHSSSFILVFHGVVPIHGFIANLFAGDFPLRGLLPVGAGIFRVVHAKIFAGRGTQRLVGLLRREQGDGGVG